MGTVYLVSDLFHTSGNTPKQNCWESLSFCSPFATYKTWTQSQTRQFTQWIDTGFIGRYLDYLEGETAEPPTFDGLTDIQRRGAEAWIQSMRAAPRDRPVAQRPQSNNSWNESMPGTLPISKPEKPISGWAATVLCHGLSRTPPGSLRLHAARPRVKTVRVACAYRSARLAGHGCQPRGPA